MRPLSPALFALMAAALVTAPLSGQSDVTPPAPTKEISPETVTPPPPTISPVLVPSMTGTNTTTPQAKAQPERAREMSPAIAAHLAEKLPKFPGGPKFSATLPSDASAATPILQTPPADLREMDKPRNTIIRLPSYMVQEDKPPVFKQRELLTPRGRLDLALRRYPGLKFGNIGFLRNDGWALAMLEEDFALERKAEMMDLISLIPTPRSGPR